MPMMSLLFSFEGRIRRQQWWLTRLGIGGVVLVILIVVGLIGGIVGSGGDNSPALTGVAGLFGLLLLVGTPVIIWIELALTAKRWHDRDKSATMLFVALIPVVGGFWTLIECGFLDGTQGPNQYGPSPKGIAGPAPGFGYSPSAPPAPQAAAPPPTSPPPPPPPPPSPQIVS